LVSFIYNSRFTPKWVLREGPSSQTASPLSLYLILYSCIPNKWVIFSLFSGLIPRPSSNNVSTKDNSMRLKYFNVNFLIFTSESITYEEEETRILENQNKLIATLKEHQLIKEKEFCT
jgi:hypothetical protein